MILHYVEIIRKEDNLRLHAELAMTNNREDAVNQAWDNLLADMSEKNKKAITLDDISIIVDVIEDVEQLSEKNSVYFTDKSVK